MLLYFLKNLIPFRLVGFENEYACDNIFLNEGNQLPNFLRTYFQLVKTQLIVMFLILFFSIVIITKYLSIEKENVLDIIFMKFLINFVGLLISFFLLSFLYAPEITTDEIYFFYMFCTFFIFYVFSLQTMRMKLDMYSDPFVDGDESKDESFRIFIFSFVLICIFFLLLYFKKLGREGFSSVFTEEFKNELLKGNNKIFLIIFAILVFLLVYMFLNALETNLKNHKLLSSLSTLVFLCCVPILLFLVFHIHKPLQGINLCKMKNGMHYSFLYEYFIILAIIQIIFYNIPKDFLLYIKSQNSQKKETD